MDRVPGLPPLLIKRQEPKETTKQTNKKPKRSQAKQEQKLKTKNIQQRNNLNLTCYDVKT